MFKDCVFWLGAVENIEDPEKRGRIQVRVFGAHDIYNPHVTDYQGRTEWAEKYGKRGGSTSKGSGSGANPSASNPSATPVKARGNAAKPSGTVTPKRQRQGDGLTVAQRNNNPMNWGKGTYSNGETAAISGEYRFDDMNDAIRKYKWQIDRYQHVFSIKQDDGSVHPPSKICNKTVYDLWKTWAPKSKNKHTLEYVRQYCASHGLSEDDPLDTDDPETMAEFIATVINTESPTRCTKEDVLIAMNGGYAPNLTAQSTLYQDGTLYIGASNATTPGASSNTGQAISLDESKNWQMASQEQYDISQANAKKAGAGKVPSTPASQTPTTDKTNKDSASKGKTTPAGAAGKKAQEETVTPTARPIESVAGTPDSTCHKLPTGDLPWALCLYPCSEYGGTSYATLPAPQVQVGAWVFGVALDGAFMNQLIVLGIMPTAINIDALSTNPNEASTKPLTNTILPNTTPLNPVSSGSSSVAEVVSGVVSGIISGSGSSSSGSSGSSSSGSSSSGSSGSSSSGSSSSGSSGSSSSGSSSSGSSSSGSGSSSSGSSGSSGSEVNGMEFNELLDGIWNAESSRSANKKRSSSFTYGAMQLMPAMAATYVLAGAATPEFMVTGLTLSEDMKKSLESIRNAYGTDIEQYLNLDENIVKFCDALLDNDTLNKAIGAAYLHDCLITTRGNGDPVLACLYYMEGEYNTREIMKALNYPNNEIPATVTYSTFISQVNDIIKEAGQPCDFEVYINNVLKDYGGVSQAEANRPVNVVEV